MKNGLKLIAMLLAFFIVWSCNTSKKSQFRGFAKYKVAIYYPNGDNNTFDMDYYKKKHMPLVASFIGSKNLMYYEVDKGISGRTPNSTPQFMAVGYFYILNIEEYNQAIGKNINTILNDFKNYTNVTPTIQISELEQTVVAPN